jgi:hypothetical protein
MRRVLSISLILLYWLGPLASILPASDDSRLPACCRRHGAHHCAMSDALAARMAEAASGTLVLAAPSHCPMYPGGAIATTGPGHALASSPATPPLLVVQPQAPVADPSAACLNPVRTRAGHGPPSLIKS